MDLGDLGAHLWYGEKTMESYELLEKELAEWSGMPYVVCCSSGTAALHLALEVLQLPSGSRVICPDFTMVACPRAITLAGLEPVFVDCDGLLTLHEKPLCLACEEWFLDSAEEEPDLKAIMAVHVYGRLCNMDLVHDQAQEYGLRVIEDCAESHGARVHSKTDAACWSFYKNKIINGEEGGAVGFRDPKHAALARQLRSLGFTEDHDFTHVPRGHNYRLSNGNAELIRMSLREYQGAAEWYPGSTLDRRIEAERWYDEFCPDEWRMPPRDAAWVYDLRIPGMMPLRQTELVRALQASGIAARHAFKPMSYQEEYRHCPVYGNGNAAVASREIVYLPLTPGQITRALAEMAFEIIRRVVG